MAVSFQNLLLLTASTTLPSARSLSATIARGVGLPTCVPVVWSLGKRRTMNCGMPPSFSKRCSSSMKRSARFSSG